MKTIHRNLLVGLGLLILLSACAIPTQYAADSTEAWVVDKDTGEPLEGVIVIAEWTTAGGNIEASGTGYLEVMETVTDSNGRFTFPAWGPKWAGLIRSPRFILFKDGYGAADFSNGFEFAFHPPVIRGVRMLNFYSNGKTVQFEKFKGTRDEYIDHISSFSNITVHHLINAHCYWKKLPHTLVTLTKLKRQFLEEEKQGLVKATIVNITTVDDIYAVPECGDPRYLKREAYQ